MITDTTLDPSIQVLTFYTPHPTISLGSQTNHVHPGLMSLLENVLLGIGESREDISRMQQDYPQFKSFYASYLVTRKPILIQYMEWLHRVMVYTHRDAVARRLLWSDSHYVGDVGVVKRVFGGQGASYPFHPFFGERLIQYYFNSRNYTIMTLREYEKTRGGP
jgi:hypothetical protein